MLRILCQLFIFFEHLARVAARPVIDPILIIITVAIVVLRTIIIAPTAPAVGLAIIHKDFSVLIKCNLFSVFCANRMTAFAVPCLSSMRWGSFPKNDLVWSLLNQAGIVLARAASDSKRKLR
jgi:hypothetical protein